MLLDAGSDRSFTLVDLKLYAKFKEPFIRETGDYYGRESTAFLSGHSVTEYMLLVHRRLGEEQKRILQYLHSIMEKEVLLPIFGHTDAPSCS